MDEALEIWKRKNELGRNYAHFDPKVKLSSVWSYICSPRNIASHAFFPFIWFTKSTKKYGSDGPKIKERELCYSAHLDRYVYQYYSFLLNRFYNSRMHELGINNVSIAYRSNLNGYCNIHFAKKAFDFIKETNGCYIIVGDFTDFFGSLDHGYLKQCMKSILNSSSLPDDFFAIYRSITLYSRWNLVNILSLNGLKNTKSDRFLLNQQDLALPREVFRANVRIQTAQPTKHKGYGIPQGSSISAVLSNLYMMEFDREVASYVCSIGGLYMRYSDDFIVILPDDNHPDIHLSKFNRCLKATPRLSLEKGKTFIYHYIPTILTPIEMESDQISSPKNNLLTYLGFSFNGNNATICDKTISKYYGRLYRKVKTIIRKNGWTKNGRKITCSQLYSLYSEKKSRSSENRKENNFIDYVKRAQMVFGPSEPIDRSTRRHLGKIRKQLRKVNWALGPNLDR